MDQSDTEQAGGSQSDTEQGGHSVINRSWFVNGHVSWLRQLLAAERTGMENSIPLFAISVCY